jgi:hypothetical protein
MHGRTPNTHTDRQRLLGKLRLREARKRVRENPLKNPVRCYPVFLPDREAEKLAAEIKPGKDSKDKLVSDLEWRRLIGQIITKIITKR